nr:MAG TPA: hypothetical protein [Caudoviricetes sp.]
MYYSPNVTHLIFGVVVNGCPATMYPTKDSTVSPCAHTVVLSHGPEVPPFAVLTKTCAICFW